MNAIDPINWRREVFLNYSTMKKNKIKILLLFSLIFGARTFGNAQILNPVHWSCAAKNINSKEAVIFIKATMDNGWHIYSQKQPDGGPLKTTITFTPGKSYQLIGTPLEPEHKTRYEKVFSIDVYYFEHSVIFRQKIHLNTNKTIVKGTVKFMVCTDEKCLPPDEMHFQVPVKLINN
jgi:hypothetical protein